jgi:cytochrome P450
MAQMEARQRRLESIDVSDPRLYQDDAWRPLFARLRRDDPAHCCEASSFGPYWSVTRFDGIFAVELDHENYSSSSELGGIQIADQPKGLARPTFVRRDLPGHTAQRRTVAPSNLVNLEALIGRRTSDVLDALPRKEQSMTPRRRMECFKAHAPRNDGRGQKTLRTWNERSC